jgi:archaellum component FlaC
MTTHEEIQIQQLIKRVALSDIREVLEAHNDKLAEIEERGRDNAVLLDAIQRALAKMSGKIEQLESKP